MPGDFSRRRRPDGAEARPAGREPRADPGTGSTGGRRRGDAGRFFPNVPSRVTVFPVARRGPRTRGLARQRAGARGCRGLRSGTSATASSDCWSATATGCSMPACSPVPTAWSARYRKVHLPFLGIDMFVDPGDRPFAVHDAGGPQGRDAYLLRRRFSRDGPRARAAGCRSPGVADELADAFGMRRRAHDPDAGDGKHRLRDGRQSRGRGERLSIHRRQLDRRPQRARAGQGGRRCRGDPPGRHRPGSGARRSTWCACRAGTRSTGSPIAGRGFIRRSSRPTGAIDRFRAFHRRESTDTSRFLPRPHKRDPALAECQNHAIRVLRVSGHSFDRALTGPRD